MRTKSPLLVVLALLALVLPSYSPLLAQSDSSSLSGAVSDPSGAVIPNAKITIRNNATGAERVITTNGGGNFTVPDVQSGNYTVRIESTGFRSVTLTDVHVDPSIGRRVDINLMPGETTSMVTVVAGANNVQTESAAVGQLVTQEQVKSVQLNGRNPLYLSQMEPGVVRNASMAAFAFGLDNGINVSGARSQESIITLDGAPMVRTRSNGTSVGVADVDSTSQIQILTTSYQAEYGRASGGQIRMVPRSGTSEFHGAAYEYFRNTALNANTWIRKASSNPALNSKPQGFRYNQFGWNLNGPVFFPGFNAQHKKLFFLLGQEFVKYNHDETVTQTTPTALMRAGNFSELLSPNIFYAGTTQIFDPNTGLAVPGNIIRSGLSANGTALLNAFPLPNTTAASYNWIDSALYSERQRKDTIVLDYVPADAHRIRFTLLNYNYDDLEPHYGNFNRNPRIFHRPNQIAVVHYAWTINASTVNELVVSAAADHVFINIDTSSGLYDRTKYGINYPYLYSAATKTIPNKIPTISIANFGILDGGPYPSHSGGIVYDLGDNLTKVFGNHTVKVGFNFERAGENNFDQIGVSSTVPGATNNQNGFFRFTDSRTNSPQTSKVAVANVAYGLFDTYGEIGQRSYTLFRGNMYEGFAQDQWRAKSNLVLEMGVRYSIMQPYNALWGNQAVFSPKDYNPASAVTVNASTDAVTGGDPLNGIVIPGSKFPSSAVGHVSTDLLTNYNRLFHGYSTGYAATVYSNVQPRLGFAWQIQPSTVLRGGAGRYFQRLGISDQVFLGGNAPFQPSSTVTKGSADNPGGIGTNAFPINFSSEPYTYPSPEAYGWNLTMEHEFERFATFTMAYVGRRGIHLEQLANINQLQPGTVQANPTVTQPDALRPYKGFSNITEQDDKGSSIYHSLQANVRRRLMNNILFGVAYTWSRSMDFGSGNGTTLPNAYDRFSNYGPSDFDTRHVMVINYVWNLPYEDHASNFAVRALLGNWQASGTIQAQTGRPLSVTQGNDYAGVGPGSGAQYWRLLHHPQTYGRFAGPTGTAQWFESAAYAQPLPGTFAPRSTRNQFYGPGFQSYNAALQKTMHVIPGHDNHTLVFKAEGFNIANHPMIDNPNTNPTSGTFGRSTTKGQTYAADRQFQFSLRYAF
jgi:hypothetical protein